MRQGHSIGRGIAAGLVAAGVGLSLSGCSLFGAPAAEPDAGDDAELTVALVPDPPGASEFYREQFDAFEEANPGITINVIENPAAQHVNAVELMFQQDEAPDVFRAQGAATLDLFHERGWVASLDDLVTDEFIARFPEGSMEPATSGLHRDGELVSVPLTWGDWGLTQPLIYNAEILAEYGYDSPPETWSELEEMARTITEGGGGQVYGFVPTATDGLGLYAFANTASPASVVNGIDLTKGEPLYEDDEIVELVDSWRQMQVDGVFEPGWESFDQAKTFTEFAAGRVAMYPGAAWHVAEIRKLSPEIEMELAAIPTPDSGRDGYVPRLSAFQPIWSMSSTTDHPEAALKLMDFLSSVEFYAAYYEKFGTLTASPSAWEEKASENPDQAALLEVSPELIRTAPNPQLQDNGGAQFWAASGSDANLSWSAAALQSIIGNVDYAPLAAQLTASMEALITESEGTEPDVRDAITFPDWDPLEDYVP